ncbi:MAG: glycoside hydrolase family 1 protein [Rudaea sp.]
MSSSFPRDFKWGVATAAHQVEGQNFNSDWWDWEQVPGHIKSGDTSRIANDWYAGRYVEDFERARELGINAIRLSIEWSRLEPAQGQWDAGAAQYYRRMLQFARQLGLEPLVTLHHYTNPRWLAAEGGWENPDVVRHFSQFARRAVGELGDLCDFWVTLNEPNVYCYDSYLDAAGPPGKQDMGAALTVLRNLTRAHAGAYYAIHDVQASARVGIAHNFRPFLPADPDSPLDRLVARLRDHIFNWLLFLAVETGRAAFPLGRGETWPEVRGTQDFIGLNYYHTDHVAFDISQPQLLFGRTILDTFASEMEEIFAHMGMIEPQELNGMIRRLAENGKPIYITENGHPDNGRSLQSHYLVTHLAAVEQAIEAGADVRGYYYWTLVDNFEWANGYQARFGLYSLDVNTQVRRPRPVSEVYARIIRENCVDKELIGSYGHPD